MISHRLALLSLVCLSLGLGCRCGAGADAGPPVALGVPADCNPLRGEDPNDCALPWPSLTYETEIDGGMQVAIPAGALPSNAQGIAVDPGIIDRGDGFSPAAPMIVHFKEGIDPTNLPGWTNLAASLDPKSPTQILDPAGNRVVHFSELDATATDPSRQALFIRPVIRLQPKTSYVVVLLRSLSGANGQTLAPPAGMQALLSGTPTDNARLEALRGSYESSVVPVLAKAGLETSQILLAWSFTTASDDYIHGHLLSMRDQALAQVGDGSKVAYTIDEVDEGPAFTHDGGAWDAGEVGDAGHVETGYARLTGTFEVPTFLSGDGGSDSTLVLDDAGVPALQGSYAVQFAAILPSAVPKSPAGRVPLVVLGHGLQGDAVEYSNYPQIQAGAEQAGAVLVLTNWTGLAAEDSDAMANAILDLNALPHVTDRLQQSVVNQIVLARFAQTALAHDPLFEPNGVDAIEPGPPYYWGVSLGGIMGGTFLAYDPDILRGVLNVPGGNWSLLIQRSLDFAPLAGIFDSSYPDAVDRSLLTSYLQALFDFSDPISTAPYLLAAPLPGVPAKQILMQEGRYDMNVSNLATEMVARTLGIPLLLPSDDTPYGLTAEQGPLPSALTIYDLEPQVEPEPTNAPNSVDNGVHDGVFATTAAQTQTGLFLLGGQAVQVCAGTQGCICPPPTNVCQ
ncbi:MAG: hypothetical protein ACYCWW_13605 [Deltaproteobacteria bacterium]